MSALSTRAEAQNDRLVAAAVKFAEDIAKQHDLLSEVAAMVDSGRLTTTLGEVLGPINADNLTRAHALIESNRTVGKLVLEGF